VPGSPGATTRRGPSLSFFHGGPCCTLAQPREGGQRAVDVRCSRRHLHFGELSVRRIYLDAMKMKEVSGPCQAGTRQHTLTCRTPTAATAPSSLASCLLAQSVWQPRQLVELLTGFHGRVRCSGERCAVLCCLVVCCAVVWCRRGRRRGTPWAPTARAPSCAPSPSASTRASSSSTSPSPTTDPSSATSSTSPGAPMRPSSKPGARAARAYPLVDAGMRELGQLAGCTTGSVWSPPPSVSSTCSSPGSGAWKYFWDALLECGPGV